MLEPRVSSLIGGSFREGRKTETLEAFYTSLSPRQKNGIQAVSMDMWNPFFQATLRHVSFARGRLSLTSFIFWAMSEKRWTRFGSRSLARDAPN